MRTSRPAPQICPLCALDEFLAWEVEAPGLWRYTCSNPGCDGYSWATTGRDPLKAGAHEGVAAELGVLGDLEDLFRHQNEPWVEYGIVEYRYAVANPAAYRRLVDMFSHTAVATGPIQNSASAFLGTCLGVLEQDGLLAKRTCKATGYWKYNGNVTAWARPGTDPAEPVLSWTDFAASEGSDPEAWTLAGTRPPTT